MGSEIERGEQAGGNGDIADSRIGDAGAETEFLGVGGHQSKQGKRVLPNDVGIENPAEGEAGVLRLLREAQDAFDGDVRLDGDPEVHGHAPWWLVTRENTLLGIPVELGQAPITPGFLVRKRRGLGMPVCDTSRVPLVRGLNGGRGLWH